MRRVPHRKWFYGFLAYIALFLALFVAYYLFGNQDLRTFLYILWVLGAIPGIVLLMKRQLLHRFYLPGAGCGGGSVNAFLLVASVWVFLFLGPALWLGAIFLWPSIP